MEFFFNQCPFCKEILKTSFDKCPQCAFPITLQLNCIVCGEQLKRDWTNCQACNTQLGYFKGKEKEIIKNTFILPDRTNYNKYDNIVAPQFWMDYRVVYERRAIISKDKVIWDGKVNKDKVIWGEWKIISNINSLKHMDSLKVSRVSLYRGELLLAVNIYDYLKASRMDLLKEIYNSVKIRGGRDNTDFIQLFLEGDISKSKEVLDSDINDDNVVSSVDPDDGIRSEAERTYLNKSGYNPNFYFFSLCQRVMFDDKEFVEDYLFAAEFFGRNSGTLIDCARVYKYLLNLPNESERLLKTAIIGSAKWMHWLTYAQCIKEILSDDVFAKKCLENAVHNTTTCVDFLRLAELWKEMFQNDDMCYKYLEEAEKHVKDSEDWESIAYRRKILFMEKPDWKGYLIKAESIQNKADKWEYFTNRWIQYGDFYEAKRCIAEFEKEANSFKDWMQCCEFLKEFSKCEEDCKRCLINTEKFCVNSTEWLQCVGLWKEQIKSEGDCKRCLINAEKVATNFNDWIRCCNNWLHLSNSKNEAIRCLLNAEKFAYEYFDLEICADRWSDLGDEERAKACMSKAKDVENRAEWWE